MNIINNLTNNTSQSTNENNKKITTPKNNIKNIEIDGKKIHIQKENFSNYSFNKKNVAKKEKQFIELTIKEHINNEPVKLRINYKGIKNEDFTNLDTWKETMGKTFFAIDLAFKQSFKKNIPFNRTSNEINIDFTDRKNNSISNQIMSNLNIQNNEIKENINNNLEYYFK